MFCSFNKKNMSIDISLKSRFFAFVNGNITMPFFVFAVGIVFYTVSISSVAMHLKDDNNICVDIHHSLYSMREWMKQSNADIMMHLNATNLNHHELIKKNTQTLHGILDALYNLIKLSLMVPFFIGMIIIFKK